MVYIYPNTLSTFQGSKETAIKAGYIEISDELYAELIETKKVWKDGNIVDDPTYPERKREQEEEEERQRRIQEIKDRVNELHKNLDETDYIAIKHSEGWISDEEFEPMKLQRQAWRDEINSLENT